MWTVLIAAGGLALAAGALAQEGTAPAQPPQPAAGGGGGGGASGLTVTEITVGGAIEHGVISTPTNTFSRTAGPIFCMIRMQNSTGAEGSIRMSFERASEGDPAERAEFGRQLSYPAQRRYRTYARASANRRPGAYRCVVRTEEGAVLSHADFTVTE
jgi:hypothetical protein